MDLKILYTNLYKLKDISQSFFNNNIFQLYLGILITK